MFISYGDNDYTTGTSMLDAGKLRSVGLLDTVGQSSRAAEVGRVVAESQSWSLVNRCPGFNILLVWSSRGC